MMTKNKIVKLLNKKFSPLELSVVDDSALHAKHKGAQQSGGGHFQVTIVSNDFDGKGQLERHRLVYEALKEYLGRNIHALAVKALTGKEFKAHT